MPHNSDQQDLYRIALHCAEKAGQYLRKRFHDDDRTITSNYRHDVKLDVDRQTEELIISMVRRKFPETGIISEEIGRDLEKLDCNWIIDPLDGSVNFSRGIPHFCTSIAFRQGNSRELSVLASRGINGELWTEPK